MRTTILIFALLVASVNSFAAFGNGYGYRRAITIDHTKVPNTDQTDFPVLVSLDSGNVSTSMKVTGSGGHVTNANGYDIIFTSDIAGTTLLNWEMESYSSTNGTVVAHVKIPSLSHTTDTVIYCFYGNASITTFQSTSTAAWNSAFKGVWHLGDGTTLNATDSTAGGNNGTLVNTPTATTGQIGGGANFTAASNQYIQGNLSAVALPVTMSAWVRTASTSAFQVILAHDSGAANDGMRLNLNDTANHPAITFGSVADYIFTNYTYSASTWYYFAVTIDSNGGTANGYFAAAGSTLGAPQAITVGTFNPTQTKFSIGERVFGLVDPFDGRIDEARISNVVRSGDWLTTEYNNQSSPSTFTTVGSETTNGGTRRVFASGGLGLLGGGFVAASPTTPCTTMAPFTISSSNLTYDNICVSSVSGPCIQGSGNNIVIKNSFIGPCAAEAVRMSGAGITLQNNEIHDVAAVANGVYITSGSSITMTGNYIHNITGLAIAVEGADLIQIDHNRIEYMKAGVYVNTSTRVTTEKNNFLNIQGPFPPSSYVQYNHVTGANNRVSCNVGIAVEGSSSSEDLINMQGSSGTSGSPIMIQYNRFKGGGPSTSSGGINLGDGGGDYNTADSNVLVDPGQYGIQIGGGAHHVLSNNKVLQTPHSWNNVGMIVWTLSSAFPCSAPTATGNIINYYTSGGGRNDTYMQTGAQTDFGGCGGPITGWSGTDTNDYVTTLSTSMFDTPIAACN